MRSSQIIVAEVERMVERSGSREVDRIRKKEAADAAIRRAVRAIIFAGGRLGGIVGGILFPEDIARSTIEGAVEENARRALEAAGEEFKRRALQGVRAPIFERRQPVGAAPTPRELEEIQAPSIPRRQPVPTRQLEPVRAPQRARIPQRIRLPAPQRTVLERILIGTSIATATTDIVGRLRKDRGTPFIDPVFTPQNPTTPFGTPTPTPLPQPQRQPTSNIDDLCRANARRRRKKREKCVQRLNVVWAGGPKKGQLAGTRCFDLVE